MFWLLILALALTSKKKPAPDPSNGHPTLDDVEMFEVGAYTVLIGKGKDGTFDWRMWEASVYQSGEVIDGREVAQDFYVPTREEALGAAKAWVDLHSQNAVGETPPVALMRRGLRLTADCSRVSVTDIKPWISHAAAVVAEYDAAEPMAEEVMSRALSAAFPECDFLVTKPTIRGATWEATRERVQSVIDKIVAGELLSVAPVEEVVAARIVGMSAPAVEGGIAEWHVGKNNGNRHAIVVLPKPGGSAFTWWVWKGPRREWDDAAASGFAMEGGAALTGAREWADEYFNTGVG